MKKIIFSIILISLIVIGFFILKDINRVDKEPFDIMNREEKISKGFLINDKGYVLSNDFISSNFDMTRLSLSNSYGSYKNIKIVKRYPNKDISIWKIENYSGNSEYFKFQNSRDIQTKDISVSLKDKTLCGTPVLNHAGYVVGINICRSNDINDLMLGGASSSRDSWIIYVDELMRVLDSNDIRYGLSTDEVAGGSKSSFCNNCNFSFNLNLNFTITFVIIMLLLFYRKSFKSTKIILKPTSKKYPTIHIGKNKEVTIGRAKRNNFVINHKWVSSEHLKIQYRDEKIYVKDLNSTNKTYIDGKQLTSYQYYPLEKHQKLILGSEEVVYEREN